MVTEQLRHAGITNVDIRLIPLEHPLLAPERDAYDPLPAYVGVLEEFEDISLDFVFVDGHYRTTCIKAAPAKLRSGGLLAVDDTNMWDASGGPPVPATWRCVDSSTNGSRLRKSGRGRKERGLSVV